MLLRYEPQDPHLRLPAEKQIALAQWCFLVPLPGGRVVRMPFKRQCDPRIRVLGYTSAAVWRIFSGESFSLNVAGVLVGLAAGAGLSHLFSLAYDTELYRFPVVLEPWRFLQTTLVMTGFIGRANRPGEPPHCGLAELVPPIGSWPLGSS